MISKKLGILGGGQLGRMSALAAARLGIQTFIYCPEQGCPASLVSAGTYFADYNNEEALTDFANMVDVITYEFENIPVETVKFLQGMTPVFPDERVLEVSQDRIKEKKFLNNIGIETAQWHAINHYGDIEQTIDLWQEDFILKTTRFGYDGKGQMRFKIKDNPKEAWKTFGEQALIAEQIVPFDTELSMIIARDKLGQMVTYGPMENEHRDGILHKTYMPPRVPLSDDIIQRAQKLVQLLAEAVDLIGVLTVELFLTKDGKLLANEIAPRTHNSGHWTIDACAVSQFENHVRSVCSMTIGATSRHSDCEMINLIGDDITQTAKYLETAGACLHLYGKHESRKGRKMGHVTLLK